MLMNTLFISLPRKKNGKNAFLVSAEQINFIRKYVSQFADH